MMINNNHEKYELRLAYFHCWQQGNTKIEQLKCEAITMQLIKCKL